MTKDQEEHDNQQDRISRVAKEIVIAKSIQKSSGDAGASARNKPTNALQVAKRHRALMFCIGITNILNSDEGCTELGDNNGQAL